MTRLYNNLTQYGTTAQFTYVSVTNASHIEQHCFSTVLCSVV